MKMKKKKKKGNQNQNQYQSKNYSKKLFKILIIIITPLNLLFLVFKLN